MAAVLQCKVLGPVEMRRAGTQCILTGTRARDVLALLAARAPGPVSMDTIIEELWPGTPPASSRKLVHKYVYQLRTALGDVGAIRTNGRAYQLDAAIAIDSNQFELLVRRHELHSALGLWRGEPYEGVDLPTIVAERRRLTELWLQALEADLDAALQRGDHARVVVEAETLLAEHELRESVWSLLIRALYAAGRQADALRACQRARAVLSHQLGVEPSMELRELERRVLAHEETVRTSTPTATTGQAERRLLTVLAVDFPVDALEDPEDSEPQALANADTARRAIEAHGGVVANVLGSLVIGFFGSPALGDDARRAMSAAKTVVAELPAARIGLATGWAIVRSGGGANESVKGYVVDVATMQARTGEPGQLPELDEEHGDPRPLPVPMVGRRHELDLLDRLWTRADQTRTAQAALIVGEAGIGKSRLVDEFLQSIATTAHRAVCLPHARSLPLLSPIPAIIGEELDAAPDLLADIEPDQAAREWLERCIRVPSRQGAVAAGPAEQMELFAAWSQILIGVCGRDSRIYVIEDVHWADRTTLDFVEYLLGIAPAVPLLILVTARPELFDRVDRWLGGRSNTMSVTLPPLTESETYELLGAMVGTVESRAGFVTRSAGNPLFAIELARLFLQGGYIDADLTNSLRTTIAARLDRLTALDRSLLNVAAVAQGAFSPQQLASMEGVDESTAADAMARLANKELLRRDRDNRWSFVHDLVRDVAYEQLTRPDRLRRHRQLAEYLRNERQTNPDIASARVAYHYIQATEAARLLGRDDEEQYLFAHFVDAVLGAADSLQLAPEAVVEHLDRALIAPHLQLELRRAELLWIDLRLQEAAESFLRAVDIAKTSRDRRGEARAVAGAAQVLWELGETDEALRVLTLSADLDSVVPDGPEAARLLARTSFLAAMRGAPEEARAKADAGLGIARAGGFDPEMIGCLNARGSARLQQADSGGYLDFVEALEIATTRGLTFEACFAYHNLAELHLWGGQTGSARQLVDAGIALSQRRGVRQVAPWLTWSAVMIATDSGQWDDALSLASTVVRGRPDFGQPSTGAALWACRVHAWRGDLAAADDLVSWFLPRIRTHRVIQQLGFGLVSAALVRALQGDLDAAASFAAEFVELTRDSIGYRAIDATTAVRVLLAAGHEQSARDVVQGTTPWPKGRLGLHTGRLLAYASEEAISSDDIVDRADEWQSLQVPLEAALLLSLLPEDHPRRERATEIVTELGASPQSVLTMTGGAGSSNSH